MHASYRYLLIVVALAAMLCLLPAQGADAPSAEKPQTARETHAVEAPAVADLSVKTEKIDIVYGTVSGNIDVVYAMAINGEWQSNNELHIEVCADQEESQKLN